ncbi:MAG: peptidylprolyl isomerase [Alphaproteobacteria bacterium]|nr:MAG: peptidylprolyl isomerase [Alphaproteobacteria bacterium]
MLARIYTDLGNFVISFATSRAPVTCHYFLEIVRAGAFDHSSIFRIVNATNGEFRAETPIHIMQCGFNDTRAPFARTIAHESTQLTGLRHKKWTVSAAREGLGEVYPSFFICMEDEPELDFGGKRHPDGGGFAAFGKITDGFDVLESIYARAGSKEYLTQKIAIANATLVNGHPS